MSLFMEILSKALLRGEVQVVFPNLQITGEELVELRCLETIEKIKAVMEDDSLDDPECFQKIEEIMRAVEEITDGVGFRHDFG